MSLGMYGIEITMYLGFLFLKDVWLKMRTLGYMGYVMEDPDICGLSGY